MRLIRYIDTIGYQIKALKILAVMYINNRCIHVLISLYTLAVNGSESLTCSSWLQGLDGQTSAVQPSRPFPVLSDGTSLVAVSSLPESVA